MADGGQTVPRLASEEHVVLNADNDGAKRVISFGFDGTNFQPVKVDPDGSIFTTPKLGDTLAQFYEDTDFVSGDSPVTLDFNTDLGFNSTNGYIVNDGVGDFTFAYSIDGSAFSEEIRLTDTDSWLWDAEDFDRIRITHTGTDSSYRVMAK